MNYPDFKLEKQLWVEGKVVAGIDEAGRGCIAGPVFAAAVIFSENHNIIDGVDDSKKMSAKKRELLFDRIIDEAEAVAFSSVDNYEIDRINILQATMLAMTQAVEKLKIIPGHLLVDGNYFKPFFITYDTIIKGDSISYSIAAASIIAKVLRDRWMTEIAHQEFPDYEFFKHKGYGTKRHYQAIEKYGICKYHRLSFLKRLGL